MGWVVVGVGGQGLEGVRLGLPCGFLEFVFGLLSTVFCIILGHVCEGVLTWLIANCILKKDIPVPYMSQPVASDRSLINLLEAD